MEAEKKSLGVVVVRKEHCTQRWLPLVVVDVKIVGAHTRWNPTVSLPFDIRRHLWSTVLRRDETGR